MRNPSKKGIPLTLHQRLNDDTVTPSEDELKDFSNVYKRLFELDNNKLIPQDDYEVDVANNPFIKYKSPDKMKMEPFADFYKLLRRFTTSKFVAKKMKRKFINKIMKTKVFLYVYNYLFQQKVVTSTEDFKKRLGILWFSGKCCLFKHVFVGIIRKGKVDGLHSHVQFQTEESLGNLVCKAKRVLPSLLERDPTGDPLMGKVKFAWNGGGLLRQFYMKWCSTMFLGSSPAFDMGLYSLCAMRSETTHVIKDGTDTVEIIVKRHKKSHKVITMYPRV